MIRFKDLFRILTLADIQNYLLISKTKAVQVKRDIQQQYRLNNRDILLVHLQDYYSFPLDKFLK